MSLEFWLYIGPDWAGLHVISERHEKLWNMTVISSVPLNHTCPLLHMLFLQPGLLCYLIWVAKSYSSFQTQLETFLLQWLPWYPHAEEGTFHLYYNYILTYPVEKVNCPQHLFFPFSIAIEWYLDSGTKHSDNQKLHCSAHTAVKCVHVTKYMLMSWQWYAHFHSWALKYFTHDPS